MKQRLTNQQLSWADDDTFDIPRRRTQMDRVGPFHSNHRIDVSTFEMIQLESDSLRGTTSMFACLLGLEFPSRATWHRRQLSSDNNTAEDLFLVWEWICRPLLRVAVRNTFCPPLQVFSRFHVWRFCCRVASSCAWHYKNSDYEKVQHEKSINSFLLWL